MPYSATTHIPVVPKTQSFSFLFSLCRPGCHLIACVQQRRPHTSIFLSLFVCSTSCLCCLLPLCIPGSSCPQTLLDITRNKHSILNQHPQCSILICKGAWNNASSGVGKLEQDPNQFLQSWSTLRHRTTSGGFIFS